MPQGSETAWLYSSSEGRKQLAASANFRRLVVVTMHRNQEYTDMQAVQSELSPMVMDLAPPAMPANQQVNKHTFLLKMLFCFEKEDTLNVFSAFIEALLLQGAISLSWR